MRRKRRITLTILSAISVLPALFFLGVIFARADSPEETAVRNYSLGIGLLLLVLSIGSGVGAVFCELPLDPAKKFQPKRFGCLVVAGLLIGFVALAIIGRIASTDH